MSRTEDSGVFEIDRLVRPPDDPELRGEYDRMLAYVQDHWEDEPVLSELDMKRLERTRRRLFDKNR